MSGFSGFLNWIATSASFLQEIAEIHRALQLDEDIGLIAGELRQARRKPEGAQAFGDGDLDPAFRAP